MNRNLLGASQLLIAALAWGGMYGLSQQALQFLDPFSLSCLRALLAAVGFSLLLLFTEGRSGFNFAGKFWRLCLLGSCGFGGFSLLLFQGLRLAPAEHGALFASLMPLISAAIGALGGQKIRRATLGCAALAIIGVLLVVSRGQLDVLTASDSLIGDLLILMGVSCWVVFSMGLNSLPGFGSYRYTALSCLASLPCLILINCLALLAGFAQWPSVDQLISSAPALSYLVLVAGVLAISQWTAGVAKLGTLNALIFMNMIPVFAYLLSFLQGQRLDGAEIAGMLLVLCALLTNNLASRIKREPVTASET